MKLYIEYSISTKLTKSRVDISFVLNHDRDYTTLEFELNICIALCNLSFESYCKCCVI